MPTQIGVFAKHWTPGRVKTRLAKAIGPEAAARVARAFIAALLARLPATADRCVVGFAPTDREPAFAGIAGNAWLLAPQCEGDLGQRMHHYFKTAFAAGADRVLLLGADSPSVPLASIAEAFAALETQRLVLGPTDDGGYYLIGARNEPPPVFEGMPFSTEELWQATTDRLAELGWRQGEHWSTAPAWYDVDTIDDLHKLQAELASIAGDPALEQLRGELTAILAETNS